MRWTLAFFLCIAFGAVAYGDTPAGTQTPNAPLAVQYIPVLPVQPVLAIPQTIQVQTLQPQFSLRWGLFRRRLVPQYRYTLGPTLTYGLMAQPSQPSFRQAQ